MDGEAKLAELFKEYLPDFEIIRDFFHVTEYLWEGTHVFHGEGTTEAELWFSRQLEMLLQGRVDDIIDELKGHKQRMSKMKKKTLKKVICYLDNGNWTLLLSEVPDQNFRDVKNLMTKR